MTFPPPKRHWRNWRASRMSALESHAGNNCPFNLAPARQPHKHQLFELYLWYGPRPLSLANLLSIALFHRQTMVYEGALVVVRQPTSFKHERQPTCSRMVNLGHPVAPFSARRRISALRASLVLARPRLMDAPQTGRPISFPKRSGSINFLKCSAVLSRFLLRANTWEFEDSRF
ncbi:unnamed protein product [Dibothriocephalus latus]|uniref:Uncharacterized protein n=1 Tax=Dibothriocephalus latus TaxID=60516 RepID=A0A3P7MW06_DIBLA|nr:unnamed protein product [Dibothriocephalus latus]